MKIRVTEEQVTLDIDLSRLVEEREFIRPKIRGTIAINRGVVAEIACACGRQGHEVCAERAFVSGSIGPKGAACFLNRTQTFIMCDRVLKDEIVRSLGMCQRHAEPDRTPVIL